MTGLQFTFRRGFDPALISWAGPDETPPEACSVCDAQIPEGAVPLMMWNPDGWCAVFCDDCVERWITTTRAAR